MRTLGLPPGRYIVAVSGGVDSVVLLDMLSQQPKLDLIVAHFDHGIRKDSHEDCLLVTKLAKNYNLVCVCKEAKLGPATSEETARNARYAFLKSTMREYRADAIITAHHQDDSIETAAINLVRGTNRRGLSSLRSTATIKRPLLTFTKTELVSYALKHGLSWREDITNYDENYLRNKIRHQLNLASKTNKKQFLALIQTEAKLNDEIDSVINDLISQHSKSKNLNRQWFVSLPYIVSKEILARWLALNKVSNINQKRLEQLVTNLKTATPGKLLDVNKSKVLAVNKYYLALKSRDR
jgi:tRNA(Ile)-lysidine synthase